MAKSQTGSKREEEAQKNAEIIAREISSLKTDHWVLFSDPDYQAFFAHAKRISELFKTLKPLKCEDRERLWNDFNDCYDQMRRNQEDDQSKRETKSKQHKVVILRFIEEGRNWVKVARGRDDIQHARGEFNKVHEWIGKHSKELLREDRQFCWDLLTEGKRELHYRIEELQGYAHSEARKAVSDARRALDKDNPYEALAQVKAARARTKGLYLSKSQAEFIHGEFNEIWESVIAKIEEYKQEKKRRYDEKLLRKAEKERKHEEWLHRQQACIQRWEEQLQKSTEYIRRLEDQIDDLENKRSNARTSEYADRYLQWIREKYEKISDVEAQIRELQNKISDVRRKIGY